MRIIAITICCLLLLGLTLSCSRTTKTGSTLHSQTQALTTIPTFENSFELIRTRVNETISILLYEHITFIVIESTKDSFREEAILSDWKWANNDENIFSLVSRTKANGSYRFTFKALNAGYYRLRFVEQINISGDPTIFNVFVVP